MIATLPFAGRQTRNFTVIHEEGCNPDGTGYCRCKREEVTDPDQAQLVCSDLRELPTMHRPVIDIDVPVHLVESHTPGHGHLYIDRPVTFDQYVAILRVLAEAGIVEWGYLDATVHLGYGSVRHPDRLAKGPVANRAAVMAAAAMPIATHDIDC